MAYDVEDKVVQMRFDNREFDPNIDASIKSLEKLEKSLEFANGTKGLNDVNKAVSKMDFSPAVTAIESLSNKFSTMEVVAISAISNISNRLTNMSLGILKQLFVAPISSGWQEYGQQMDSTQVIMANTGDEIGKVTQSLDQLNEYADLTVYSFGQMTQAIGKFAAASVDLDSSVAAIKGLSNAAALVGASDANLYSAYYNLSQALQLGALTAIDWRPLQYSMIGTRTMQKVFIETAISMGRFTRDSEQAQKAMSDFKGSLSSKWLDKEVVVNALKVYSLNIEELTKQVDSATGEIYYLNKEGEKIPEWMAKLGTSATKAATEIKNLKQLWDVLREEAQTGWADNWKIIIGDLNEAKELWTNVGDRITSILHTINGAVKEVIQTWRDNGDRNTLISVLEKTLDNLRIGVSIFFRILNDIIPITNEHITLFTNRLNEMADVLHLNTEEADSLYRVLSIITLPLQVISKLIMVIYEIGYFVISSVIEGIKVILDVIAAVRNNISLVLDLFGITKDKVIAIISVLSNFRSILISIINMIVDFTIHSLKLLVPVIQALGKLILSVIYIIFNAIKKISETDTSWFSNLLNILYSGLVLVANIIIIIADAINEALNNGLGDFIVSVVGVLGMLLNVLSKVASVIVYIVTNVLQKVAPLLGAIGKLIFSITNLIFRLLSALLGIDASNIDEFINALVNKLAIGINAFGNFIENVAKVINGLADVINNSDLLEVGSWIINSLINGVSKTIPVIISTLIKIGQLIIETIRNILQIHSESPLFFGIGMWIPQSIANAEEAGIPIVKSASEKLSEAIYGVFANNPRQIQAQKQIEEWNNTITKLVSDFNDRYIFRFVLSLTALIGVFTIMFMLIRRIPRVGEFFEMFGDIGESFKIKALNQTIQAISSALIQTAVAVLILRLAINKISNVDFARIAGILAATVGSIFIFILTAAKIAKKLTLADVRQMAAIAGMVSAISSTLAIMAVSLRLLNGIKIDSSIISTLMLMYSSIVILTLIAKNIAKDNSKIGSIIVGVLAIESLIIAITAMTGSLKALGNRTFNSKGVVDILLALSFVITNLSILAKLIVGKDKNILKTIAGALIIENVILSLIPLINSITILHDKDFNSKKVIEILLALSFVITELAFVSRIIVSKNKDIVKAIAGIVVIQGIIFGLIPLIDSITILHDKDFNAKQIAIVLGSLSLVITELSILARLIVGKYKDIGKAIAGIAVVQSMILSLIPLMGAVSLLNKADVSKKTIAQLSMISTIVSVLSSVVSHLVITNNKAIFRSIVGVAAFQIITGSIIELMYSLKALNDVNINSDDIIVQLGLIAGIVFGMTFLVTKLIAINASDIGKALIGIAAYSIMTADLIGLMHYLKLLNNVNISRDTMGQVWQMATIISVLTAIGALIGKGTYYTAIGAAAIVAISAALLIAAEALKRFTNANLYRLNKGFEEFRDILAGNWGNFAKTIGALLALSALVPILSLLAPAIDIAAIGIWLMSVAMLNASTAIHQFISDMKELLTIFSNVINTLAGNLLNYNSIAKLVTLFTENIGSITQGVKELAGGIALIGAAMGAVALGFSLLLPFTVIFIQFLNKLSTVLNNFTDNLNKLTESINVLANNSAQIDVLLTTIEKHLNSFKILIAGIFVGGFIDKGKTFKRMIIALALAFTIAAGGVIKFGLGLAAVGKGLIWLSVGVSIAKSVLGEELNNIITKIRSNINMLIERFGALKTSIIVFSRISTFVTTISAFAFWLGYIGKNLKNFGSGLIRTSIGAMLFAFAMKKVAEGLIYVQQTNPTAVIFGLISVIAGLSAVSLVLGRLAPLMKQAAGGIALLSLSFILLSGGLGTLVLVLNVLGTMFTDMWELYGFIAAFSAALGVLAPFAVLAGIGIGTLGASMTILALGLAGLIGVIALANATVGGLSGLWELYGFIAAFSAALGALFIPSVLAGIGVGTLGAGLIVLAAGLAAISGAIAIFANVIKESDLLRSIFDQIVNAVTNVKNSFGQILLKITTFFSTFFPEFKSNLISNFETIGWWIPESIKDGIESAISSVCDAATNVAQKIESTIRNILDIHSESPKLFDIGKWVPLSIADGENSFASKAWDGAKNVASGIWDTIDKVTNGRAKQSVNNIKNKLGNLKNTLSKIFDFKNKNGLFGNIADKLANIDFGKWLKVDAINFDKVDFGGMADSLSDVASGLGNVGSAASTTKGTIEQLTDTIRNQMKVFERFDDEDILNPKELIHNMESQVKGITNWANGLETLAARGMSAELMQYLSEMGPEGYKYVESFLEMTSDEFARANDLYAQSVTLPERAADTIRHGYEMAGVDIVESVTNAANGAAGGISNAFDGVKTEIIDGSTEIGKKVASEAIEKGELTATTIRELAGEAGRAGELYFAPELNRWLSSSEFQEMKDQLQSVYKFNAGDLMDQFSKAKPTNHVDTSKTIFDHDYLNKIAQSDGVFYLDGFGEALSSSQYIAKCMEKGGQLLPAVIDDSVKPDDLGEKMGKTCVEWAAMSIEDGSEDLGDAMETAFGDAIDESSGSIWDMISDWIDELTTDEADLYEDKATEKLTEAVKSTWYSVMEADSTYQKKQQEAYDQWYKNAYGKANNYTKGLVDGQNDSKTTAELKNAALKNANTIDKTTKNGLHENSPSELAEEAGMYWVMGLANGLSNYAYLVSDASEDLSQNPIDSLANTIKTISSIFTDDLDTEPTIRPVLDMSNVDANADYLDTLFSTQQATIAANAQVKYTHDDSIAKLKSAYADVINSANAQLVMAIQNSEQPINVNVTLEGDASTFFSAMVDQTRQRVASGANNPFLITNRNGINAALV